MGIVEAKYLILQRYPTFKIPNSRFFDKRRIILRDPDGFQIEIIEDNAKEKY